MLRSVYDINSALQDIFISHQPFTRILDSIALRKNPILQGPLLVVLVLVWMVAGAVRGDEAEKPALNAGIEPPADVPDGPDSCGADGPPEPEGYRHQPPGTARLPAREARTTGTPGSPLLSRQQPIA